MLTRSRAFEKAEESVLLDRCTARVPDGDRGHVELTSDLKTEKSYRSVPLPAVVADALSRHLTEFDPHAELGLLFMMVRRRKSTRSVASPKRSPGGRPAPARGIRRSRAAA